MALCNFIDYQGRDCSAIRCQRAQSEGAGGRFGRDIPIEIIAYPGVKVVVKRTFIEVELVSNERVCDMIGSGCESVGRDRLATIGKGHLICEESTDESTGHRSESEASSESEGAASHHTWARSIAPHGARPTYPMVGSADLSFASTCRSIFENSVDSARWANLGNTDQRPMSRDQIYYRGSRGGEEQTLRQASCRVQHSQPIDTRSTLVFKHLPLTCTGMILSDMLNEIGFGNLYDFIYVPWHLHKGRAFGFAFVNMISNDVASKAMTLLDGFSGWNVPGEAPVEVKWCDPHQGLKAQIARYQNSPIMHESVPTDKKPMLFCNGRQLIFPRPTQEIDAPNFGKKRSC